MGLRRLGRIVHPGEAGQASHDGSGSLTHAPKVNALKTKVEVEV